MGSSLDALIFGIRTARQNGVAVASRDEIDFLGAGVSVADNPATKRTEVTIPGASGVLQAGQGEAAWTAVAIGGNSTELVSVAPNTRFGANQTILLTVDLIARGNGIDSDVSAQRKAVHAVSTYTAMLETDDAGLITVQDDDTSNAFDNGSTLGASLVSDDKAGTFSLTGLTSSLSVGWSLFLRARSYQKTTTDGNDT